MHRHLVNVAMSYAAYMIYEHAIILIYVISYLDCNTNI